MHLILAAALCSVCVSILFKLCKQRGIDSMQMLMWNYVIASTLCWIWFKPDFSHLSMSNTPWWIIIFLALLLPSIFLILGQSLQRAGMIKTEIAQRLSVVLSVLAAYLLFQEQFNLLKLCGLALGIAAVLSLVGSTQTRLAPDPALVISKPNTGVADNISVVKNTSVAKNTSAAKRPSLLLNSASLSLLLVWVGYAVVDILLKYTSSLGLQFAVTLNLTFILACAVCLSVVLVKKSLWRMHAIGAGLLLGGMNFANIALYVQAHQLLKDSPAVVFAGMNILVVVLGAVAGGLIFKERFNTRLMLAIIFGIAGVMCLGLSLK